MKRFGLALSALLLTALAVWAGNPDTINTVPAPGASFYTNLETFLKEEDADRFAEMFRSFTVSGGTHGTTSGTLTATPTALIAYPGGGRVTESGSITYDASSTCYVVATRATTGNVTTFTRVAGTHYAIDCASGAEPAQPTDAVRLMTVTTNGTEVTAVTDRRTLTPVSATTGTGFTAFAVGDVLYADTTSTLARLADVATGNALISGGVNTAPSWGKVALTTHVSGTLPIANGGTALTSTPTNGQLLIGNGTNYTLAAITAGSNVTVTNGSGTITIASTASAVDTWSVRGNDSARASATTMTLSADSVVLRNTTDGTVVRHAPGDVTNTITAAGPTANGRCNSPDGAFSNAWVHFYWVWNGTTLASCSDTVAPPTGPTLPSGYTHWAYCCAVYSSGASNLLNVRVRGSWVYYIAMQNALTDGTATAETAVSLTTLVPSNALRIASRQRLKDAAGGLPLYSFRVVTGSDYFSAQNIAGVNLYPVYELTFPNVSQQFLYLWASAPTTGATVDILGYAIPNGGE